MREGGERDGLRRERGVVSGGKKEAKMCKGAESRRYARLINDQVRIRKRREGGVSQDVLEWSREGAAAVTKAERKEGDKTEYNLGDQGHYAQVAWAWVRRI